MSTVTTRAAAASGRTGAEQVPTTPQEATTAGVMVVMEATRGILDYSRPEGIKTFQSVTRSVYGDSSELFNCEREGLFDLLELTKQRSNVAGFERIYQIPHRDTPTSQPVVLHFLTSHGRITLDEVQAHAASYVGTQTRDAQDSIMLYNMLWNSLSAAGRTKVVIKSDRYTINGITAGVPFLKVIIEVSGTQTHATVSNIRTQLAGLDAYMSTVDSDILKFNIQVKTLMLELRNHGETSTDLMIHLIKGYKAAKDDEFVRFIKSKEELYEEGAEMTPEDLMDKAEGKYKILVGRGEWKASAQADKRILALETKIRNMEKKNNAGKNNRGKTPSTKGKSNAKDSPQAKDKKTDIADWMKEPPKSGEESKPKKVDNKEYWWCTALKRWCRHKPVDCRMGKEKEKKFSGKNDQKKKLKFAKALEAIDGHDDTESDSELWRFFLYLLFLEFIFGAKEEKEKPIKRSKSRLLALSLISMQIMDGKHMNFASFDTDSAPVGIDNRCTACISHDIRDFEDPPIPTKRHIKGFGGTRIDNVRMGTLRWKIEDDSGMLHTFLIPNSYYVPQGGVRLFSPQHWAKSQKDTKPRAGTGETTTHDTCTLFWDQRRYKKTVPLDHRTNVATFCLASGYSQYHAFCAEADIDDDDDVLEPMCYEATASDMSPTGDTSTADPSRHDIDAPAVTNSDDFNFDVYSNGPTSIDDIADNDEDKPDNVSAEFLRYHLRFGHCSPKKLQLMATLGIIPRRLAKCPVPICSAFDQLISRTPGLIAQMAGFLTRERYTAATVFVDQYSSLSYVHLQKSTSAYETLQAKEAFERYAKQRGVTIKHYHADNGTFAAQDWVRDCYSKQQGLSFASVNAHHQNGKAENRIRQLQNMARTMLIFAAKRWPEAVTTHLWPYAIKMANDSINATPWLKHPGHQSPEQVFSGTVVNENPTHWHHFGCPAYVLDDALQQGKRRPKGGKWMERSRIGLYLGRSPQHSRNVALVLNLQTGRVSPQFHVTLDSLFTTVKNSTKQERPVSLWQEQAGFVAASERKSTTDPPAPDAEFSLLPPAAASEGAPVIPPQLEREQQPPSSTAESAPTTSNQERPEAENPVETSQEAFQSQPTSATAPKNIPIATRRSSRKHSAPKRLIAAMEIQIRDQQIQGEIFSFQAMFPEEEEDTGHPLLAFKATSDPDTMYLHQAMKEPDKDQFMLAMRKEIDSQMDHGGLELKHINDVPKNATILPAVWQMKRKRDIRTQKVKKWKARLNIDGSRMVKHRDYDQTYAPVASWNSIRLLLILVLIHGWHTKQLDYVLAFTQAPVERDLYMKIPRGFEVEGAQPGEYVFKLRRNTYGQKQAGRVWNQYLVSKLKSIGFEQSAIEECVFYKGKMIYVLYTDDSILAGPDKTEIANTIKEMQAILDMTVEGDLSDFLGVNIERKESGEIEMTQPHLIQQVLDELRLPLGAKTKETPARSSVILQRFKLSPLFDNSFHFSRLIGKLNYLERGSRPDIAYAVHQCARFSKETRKEHGDAARWLGRYLLGTKDKGMILKPDLSKSFEVFVDADFCGNYHRDESHDPDNVRSRHGYIITYAGCPITWKSQLQTEIALSSTESEYTGLSYALREAIPIMELLKEMKAKGFDVLDHRPKVHCRVFEDNSGALEIATTHKWRPRTKHLAVKLHHFRDYVVRKEITIHKIGTENQPADILTKPLNTELLRRHRKAIMGW
ncbi:hypothetical protein FisN_3Hu032 [Fistulifera solaris]|uniref:Integrase catalytic domain-containing protein n=1 Tax=Fistulifera solaris TaxID=1519565 RepID=A0A1Z5JNG0_FISSO|nr:hypothetical protein FisN_3Hu032 [Fistulifera solaris]|eukprot:GAX15565.1 hypothetical protein FisN_3Hu032 [Fistulifera solaris]